MNRISRCLALVVLPGASAACDSARITGNEPGGPSYTQAVAGYYHSCGLTTEHGVYCWGGGRAGQIGTWDLDFCSDSIDGPTCALKPVAVEMPGPVTALTAGGTHMCALVDNGAAYCWGSNDFGQLGNPLAFRSCDSYGNVCSAERVRVSSGPAWVSISAGDSHTCAINTAGEAECWGYGSHGRLGTGATTHEPMPANVTGGLRFRTVDAGGSFTCGVTVEGRAYCWGYNHLGQLGDGATSMRLVPTAVLGDLVFDTISAGIAHACALTPEGAAYCWGANEGGELGTGGASRECDGYGCDPAPRPVLGGHVFSTITVGSGASCGATATGVLCWGSNEDSQTGTGQTDVVSSPTPVEGVTLRTVDAAIEHGCGIAAAGAAYCWGVDVYGRIGTGEHRGRYDAPVRVVPPDPMP